MVFQLRVFAHLIDHCPNRITATRRITSTYSQCAILPLSRIATDKVSEPEEEITEPDDLITEHRRIRSRADQHSGG
ncbi:hypothetical protein AXFE_04560 [Acidithrix ferrooxidans]|uniref:Uncharacterized protein n=1 Tax=Acidithrix ferrooxidans TaxID=1280514 RepID=A0A0D8HKY1_9ACTN|nr:hypothetical protein AXFE_04560 [Acidithrix ferrooxidans]